MKNLRGIIEQIANNIKVGEREGEIYITSDYSLNIWRDEEGYSLYLYEEIESSLEVLSFEEKKREDFIEGGIKLIEEYLHRLEKE